MPTEPVLTRRAFVGAGGAVVAGVVLAGCGSKKVSDQDRVNAFVTLSSVVTGVRQLPRKHAPSYLAALDGAGLKVSPSDFLDAAGYLDGKGPRTVAALEASGAFTKPGGEACARAIAGAWWSGTVTNAKKQTKLITYDDALVFRAMPWAQPQATCLGMTGAWSKPTPA